MAGFFQARQAGDLALGKPPLRRFLNSATVGEALKALKKHDELDLSLWEELDPATQKSSKEVSSACNGAAKDAQGISRSKQGFSNVDDFKGLQGLEKEKMWRCVGKVAKVDIICFLACDASLADMATALNSPVASLVAETAFVIEHVDSQTKLFEALGQLLDGVQNLVVAVDRGISNRLARYNSMSSSKVAGVQNLYKKIGVPHDPRQVSSPPILRKSHSIAEQGVQEYCWLTPEDVVRFLLSCIGLFSPLPMITIQQLGIINREVLTVDAEAPAIAALRLIQHAAREMTAVAVVEEGDDNEELKLVGEISAFTMKGCDETAAFALATLSVKNFLSYLLGCGGPADSLVELVQAQLHNKMESMQLSSGSEESKASVQHLIPSESRDSTVTLLAAFNGLDSGGESSDDDAAYSPNGPFGLSHASPARLYRSHSFSKGRLAPNTCRPWSSLVAVMAQALTHRVGYIWVTDDDSSLLGIVTYLDIVKCLLSHLYSAE